MTLLCRELEITVRPHCSQEGTRPQEGQQVLKLKLLEKESLQPRSL